MVLPQKICKPPPDAAPIRHHGNVITASNLYSQFVHVLLFIALRAINEGECQ